MPVDPGDPAALALRLVREGWVHLQAQRPLAAWASWRHALRVDPGQEAAAQALDRLAHAEELPASARAEYRFRAPREEAHRHRWDAVFTKDSGAGDHERVDLSELATTERAFARLAEADPTDADARFNQALCLAWLGRNLESIAALDVAVELSAAVDFEGAVEAWRLAEVLRQGGGAETLADEFRHVYDFPAGNLASRLADSIHRGAVLRRLPPPDDRGEVDIHEWLDRPFPKPSEEPLRLDRVPRVNAIVIESAAGLRLSIAGPDRIVVVEEWLLRTSGDVAEPAAIPLALALIDAAVWSIRIPTWVEAEDRKRIYRETVEDFHENCWIHRPRQALDGRSPLAVGERAANGDRGSAAKIEAIIRFREETAERPSSIELYQGYPFDRLRKRLGLPPKDADAIDAIDVSCLSSSDLDRLDPSTLDDLRLVDAFRSAASLGDDSRSARFASAIIDRGVSALSKIPLEAVFAPLVRHALAEDQVDSALLHVDEAIEAAKMIDDGRESRKFSTWRAELLSRIDRPDEALDVYLSLLENADSPEAVALDGAATLLSDGHGGHARRLATDALESATARGNLLVAREAEDFLHRLDD